MMGQSKFTAVMDEHEKTIKARVAEIIALAHGMTRDGRKALATKLEEVLAKVKGEVVEGDTAVIAKDNGNAD